MDSTPNLEEVRRARGIFLAGSCLLVIGVPLGMWGLARELLVSGSTLVRYWEPVGYPVAVAVMHSSAVYFVWRFSRFFTEPIWRTLLWCVLAFVVFPFFVIPAAALLVKAQRLERELVDAQIEAINAELHQLLLTEPTESEILDWMSRRGFHPIEPDVYSFQLNADLALGRGAAGPAPFCRDFRSPELRRVLRVGRGPQTRPDPGAPIGPTHYVVPDRILEADMHHQRAVELGRRGETEAAILAFRQAIALAPEAASSRNSLGLLLARMGRYEEAAAEFGEACRLSPGWAEARTNLGCALHDMGLWQEAESELRRAIADTPSHANAHFNLAIVLGKTDRFEEARGAVLEALALDPSNIKARLYLADLEVAMGG